MNTAKEKTTKEQGKKKVTPKEKKGDTKYMVTYPNIFEENRVIILNRPITDGAFGGIAVGGGDPHQDLLRLFNQDPKKPITIYIDCPGGVVSTGLSVISVMKMIQAHGTIIRTVCTGMAASMGSHILAAGTKGYRYCHDSSYGVMIHQVSGGMYGKMSDLKVTYEHISTIDDKLARMLSEYTGQPFDKVLADLHTDYWMTPHEALEYGIVDSIITNSTVFETVLDKKENEKKK